MISDIDSDQEIFVLFSDVIMDFHIVLLHLMIATIYQVKQLGLPSPIFLPKRVKHTLESRMRLKQQLENGYCLYRAIMQLWNLWDTSVS